MDRTADAPPTSTSSAPAGAAGRLPARAATSLAGLIDVLDRVDGSAAGPARRRPASLRPAALRPAASGITGHRPGGFRATAARSTPLRSVQPAPTARSRALAPMVEPGSYWDMTRPPAPAVPVEGAQKQPFGAPTRLTALIRRAALWGAGADGENLAWRTAIATAVPAQFPFGTAPRIPRLRSLVRRAALWGAGENGANLAWGAPRPAAAARRLDPPVLLREMPSTPRIQPAATSPAAARIPAVPASVGRRPIGPVLPRVAPAESAVGWSAPADPGMAALSGWPAAPTGWPSPPEWPAAEPVATRSTPSGLPESIGSASTPLTVPTPRFPISSPRERGLAKARSDPLPSPARGSPQPLRRSRPSTPSASIWSPAPASLPPPCPASLTPG